MARRFDRVGWAMDQPGLSSPQKFVLVILALAAAEIDGACWLSHATIAERTSLGESTVRRVLGELVEKELVVMNHRFMENGKQTSNLYQLGPYQEGAQSEHPSLLGASTTPARSEHHVEPTTKTNRKNNSSTTSKTRSSRRAARERAEEGWADPARAAVEPEPEVEEPTPGRPISPDSAWALNGYYRDAVFHAGQGFLGNTNDAAMRRFFAAAKRAGVTPDTLRAMVDTFVRNDRMFTRSSGARWRVFIANAETLRQMVGTEETAKVDWEALAAAEVG